MNMAAPPSPKFSVRCHKPELVKPAKPTPRELKRLSDIDDQEGFRFQIPFIMFYRENPQLRGKDPVTVIKEALAKTLVHYYPFAGRLREGPNRKLMVDCTGEGVLFIEADADVTFDQLGDAIQPTCPCLQELLHDVPGSQGILDCPLLLIQVTRLKCGGFIFGIRLNHIVSDSIGLFQFLITIGEMARGACAPSQTPVWNREILNAQDPPRVTCVHHECKDINDINQTLILNNNNMVQHYFFFGPKQMRSIRMHLPPHHRTSSTFAVITACLWRCHTVALKLDPNDVVGVSYAINLGGNNHAVQLPLGYYGNAAAYPMVLTKAKELLENPLEYALEMVKKVKTLITEEFIKSVADFMVIKGRPRYTSANSFLVADTTRVRFEEINFGWGKAVYGGVAGPTPRITVFSRFKNNKGEDGIVVPIWLPLQVMERFQEELVKMTQDPVDNLYDIKPSRIASML